MPISFYDFANLHHEEFKVKIKQRLNDIIDKNSFIEGEYNSKFEEKFAQLQKSKHCLLVANGTDALEIALTAYGIGPGDRVGVPGITFYATAEAVINRGATPIWIDIQPEDGLLCPESLKRMHAKYDLQAVMPVHIYGLPAPMEEINQFCHSQGILVIEDAAQAQGTFYKEGSPVGDTDNLVTFSFYPTKNLSAFGDAGGILTRDDRLKERIIVNRNHGRGDEQHVGRNSRCDHIQAAVLYTKLEEIEKFNEQRKKIAVKFHKALKETPLKTLPEKYLPLSSWHLYPTQLESISLREGLMEYLKKKGIPSAPFYDKALSQEGGLLKYKGEDTHAKNFAGKTLCLPMTPFITDEEIEFIVSEIKNFFSS